MIKYYLSVITLLSSLSIKSQGQNLVYPTNQSTGGALTTVFGINAGAKHSSFANSFFGYEAGRETTEGHHNLFMGGWAGRDNTTGYWNLIVGQESGLYITTGVGNAIVGNNAGNDSSLLTGTELTLIGSWALAANGLSNATAIGNRAKVTTSNSLVLGGMDSYAVNVGIGTTAPANKLHVVGDAFVTSRVGIGTNNFPQDEDAKLIVDGKILAEDLEVKNVKADHVFGPTYKLRSLSEVEKYINQHKHLPDVPAASETEKGVKVAEFNTLLLQKIEELTLYVIQQRKEINTLKARLANKRSVKK